MRARTLLGALLAAVALAAVALAPLSGAAEPQAKTAKKSVKVKVGDDYFAPTLLKIKKGTKVKWKWLPENGNPHNVTLDKGPKKVKKKDFTSATGSHGVKFARTFKKAGRYDFVCTIHRTVMTQTVKVKKKKKKKKK